jgi:hypothetical protein
MWTSACVRDSLARLSDGIEAGKKGQPVCAEEAFLPPRGGLGGGAMATASLRALGLYVVLTIALTWPLVTHLRTIDPGDSAFFAWEIGWELHAFWREPLALPHANIFHPNRDALGMDEPILGTTLLLLPLSLVTDNAVLLFHVARLLTFVLSAFTAYLLARDLECGEGASLVAGLAFAFSPIRTSQLNHLSNLGSQWLPLVLMYLFRFGRDGRRRDALWAGVFYALAFYACGYHGVIGLVVLPLAALPIVWKRWHLLVRALPAIALAGVLLLPLQRLHHAALTAHGHERSEAETTLHSASLESFLATSPWNRLYGDLTGPVRGNTNLFPGLMIASLVACGSASAWKQRRTPSVAALSCAVLAVAAAAFALGPRLQLMGHDLGPGPLAFIRKLLPVLSSIRVYGRGGIFLALALAILGALVLKGWRSRPVLVAVCAAAILVESLITPIPFVGWMQVVDTRQPPPPVYEWLAEQQGGFAIVELPLLPATLTYRKAAFDESIYMVRSTTHWKRLVNGYSGIEPALHREAREASLSFPAPACLAVFRRLGVRYVIVHRRGYSAQHWVRIAARLPLAAGLREVARFEDDLVLELLAVQG